jgi:NTP pyrophosphatase (non-canonical NTP hydrolase)
MDSLENLRGSLRNFAKKRDWEHFTWLSEAEVQRLTASKKREIAKEIGDVLLYLIRLSDKLGIDPAKAAAAKLKINARKYPVGRAKGSHKKYTEY